MKTVSKISHARFWALLKQLPDYNENFKEEIKQSYVKYFSNGETESLSLFAETRPFHYQKMIKAIEKEIKASKKNDNDRHNAQRRKLLALIYTFCKHKKYECSKVQALQIACKSCNVTSLNQASEQKLIAAIKRFENNETMAWVDSIFSQLTTEVQNEMDT